MNEDTTPTHPTALGRLLLKAREARDWSLSEAAFALGSTKAHLHALETGKSNNPTLRLLARIVIVYGIRPETLIACAVGDGAD